jgi:PTH1 family peptidyl-tRNA hydrolase
MIGIMQFVVGLGNPGEKYQKTRHNAGFMVLNEVVQKITGQPYSQITRYQDAFFLEPQTYMNESGKAVRELLAYYDKSLKFTDQSQFENLFVIYDDLDIPVGSYKIQFGKGPKVHNGVNSVYDHLHSDQFWHIRIGVDGRNGVRDIPGHEYVLSSFSPAEHEIIFPILQKVADEVISKLQLQ